MNAVRRTHQPLMLRSRMIRAVAWLRARPWGVLLSGLVIDLDGLVSLLAGSPLAEAPTDADLRRFTTSIQRMNGGPLLDDATLRALSRASNPEVDG